MKENVRWGGEGHVTMCYICVWR